MTSYAKETIRNLAILALILGAIMTLIMAAFFVTDAHNCHERGGHYSVEGTTAWCRF